MLAFSCKTKCCPSCSQRRSLEFGERVVEDIIDDLPVRSGIVFKGIQKKMGCLNQKTWDTDPLVCPKCSGAMRIVGFIDDEPVINRNSNISMYGKFL